MTSGGVLEDVPLFALSAKTMVVAITNPDAPPRLNPSRDVRLQANDTVYLVGPYRELLNTSWKGQVPAPVPMDAGADARVS
ncbi:hypothetical protein [Mycobacterium sp.]|uniref:hypothetical protein n=1 Tax=Mycobacterium sp. TaxID=1785 RepID=UPI0031E40DF9